MENKYYIPDISEFHVGFEYESYDIVNVNKLSEREWVHKIYTGEKFDTDGISTSFKLKEHPITKEHWVRVKYLDKDDIESLGFTCKGVPDELKVKIDDPVFCYLFEKEGSSIEYINWFVSDTVKPGEQMDYNKAKEFRLLRIKSSDDIIVYRGDCKNKSELKRLLKLLRINE